MRARAIRRRLAFATCTIVGPLAMRAKHMRNRGRRSKAVELPLEGGPLHLLPFAGSLFRRSLAADAH
eukprot:scaffold12975_cov34-Tisochrysis_lutea.AAC.4